MNYFVKFIQFMDGKKTYTVSLLVAIYTLVKAFGVEATPEQDMAIYGLLASLFGLSVRQAIEKK